MAQIIELGQRTLNPNSKDFWVNEYNRVFPQAIRHKRMIGETIILGKSNPNLDDPKFLESLQIEFAKEEAYLIGVKAKIKTFEKGNNNG